MTPRATAELKAPSYGCPSTIVAPYDAVIHFATTARHLDRLEDQFGDAMDRENLTEGIGGCCAVVDTQPETFLNYHVIVAVDLAQLADEPTLLAGTVAHEFSHAVGCMAGHYGFIADAGEEHVAHLLGWLVSWAWARLPRPTVSP